MYCFSLFDKCPLHYSSFSLWKEEIWITIAHFFLSLLFSLSLSLMYIFRYILYLISIFYCKPKNLHCCLFLYWANDLNVDLLLATFFIDTQTSSFKLKQKLSCLLGNFSKGMLCFIRSFGFGPQIGLSQAPLYPLCLFLYM